MGAAEAHLRILITEKLMICMFALYGDGLSAGLWLIIFQRRACRSSSALLKGVSGDSTPRIGDKERRLRCNLHLLSVLSLGDIYVSLETSCIFT